MQRLACPIIVVFRWLLPVLLAWLASTAWAAVPVLVLDQGQRPPSLMQEMASQRLPLDPPLGPDALWRGETGTPVPPGSNWHLDTGERLVGRVTLAGMAHDATYVIQVPISFVDEVRVWSRTAGGPWTAAVAGDRIALSRWPFAGQFPAFILPLGREPVDVVMAAANVGPLQVSAALLPDAAFRENGVRRANLVGMIMGLGLMVTVVSVLGALVTRRLANWLLALVSASMFLTIACLNGYMAVWLTPEAPAFNDASKPFASVVLCGLLVALVAASLDRRRVGRVGRVAQWAFPVVGLAYASMQAFWLPMAWRFAGVAVWVLLTAGCCVALSVLNLARGGRHAGLVVGGVGCFIAAMLLAFVPQAFLAGLDLRAAAVAVLLYSALLLIRQALIARERYGRDVLGRAAVSANRDPLTALLSYSGFELAYDEAVLRQNAGTHASSVMLFLLPGLEKSGADHGFVLTERALVRFAAALQGALGDAWSISRLSKTRFACIGSQPGNETQLAAQATQVLARCARMTQPLAPVADFGLRIACVRRRLASDALKPLLLEMEQTALAMQEGKRIAMV